MNLGCIHNPQDKLIVNLPVAWKMAVNDDMDELMDKVEEELREFKAMKLLADEEIRNNGEISTKTKEMLCMECVDLIFAANTSLASIVVDENRRNDIFNKVYRKNYERGYYDIRDIGAVSKNPDDKKENEIKKEIIITEVAALLDKVHDLLDEWDDEV